MPITSRAACRQTLPLTLSGSARSRAPRGRRCRAPAAPRGSAPASAAARRRRRRRRLHRRRPALRPSATRGLLAGEPQPRQHRIAGRLPRRSPRALPRRSARVAAVGHSSAERKRSPACDAWRSCHHSQPRYPAVSSHDQHARADDQRREAIPDRLQLCPAQLLVDFADELFGLAVFVCHQQCIGNQEGFAAGAPRRDAPRSARTLTALRSEATARRAGILSVWAAGRPARAPETCRRELRRHRRRPLPRYARAASRSA